MQTLRLMMENNRQEEAAMDALERKRTAARKAVVSDDEIKVQGEELYVSAVRHVTKNLKAGVRKSEISCKLRPNSVFDYVVTRFKNKGWKAKHSYNDGYNNYDFLIIEPPDITDQLLKMLQD